MKFLFASQSPFYAMIQPLELPPSSRPHAGGSAPVLAHSVLGDYECMFVMLDQYIAGTDLPNGEPDAVRVLGERFWLDGLD